MKLANSESVLETKTGPSFRGEFKMHRFKNKLIVIGTVAVLTVIGTLTNSPYAAVQGASPNSAVTVLASQGLTVTDTVTSNNPQITNLDVSGARAVRVNVRWGGCGPCSSVSVVEVISNGTLIDSFGPIDPDHIGVSRVYDVLGTQLTLRFGNSSAASNSIFVTVLGRS